MTRDEKCCVVITRLVSALPRQSCHIRHIGYLRCRRHNIVGIMAAANKSYVNKIRRMLRANTR